MVTRLATLDICVKLIPSVSYGLLTIKYIDIDVIRNYDNTIVVI